MGLVRGADGQGEWGYVALCILLGNEKSALEMCGSGVSGVLTTVSFILTPCLAAWSGTPALSAGPSKGATQDHCPSVNDRRYKAEQSREGLETKQQADSS